jgi:hypothetical protein
MPVRNGPFFTGYTFSSPENPLNHLHVYFVAINTASSYAPQIPLFSKDVGIEPRGLFQFRSGGHNSQKLSNHSARCLIHSSDLISAVFIISYLFIPSHPPNLIYFFSVLIKLLDNLSCFALPRSAVKNCLLITVDNQFANVLLKFYTLFYFLLEYLQFSLPSSRVFPFIISFPTFTLHLSFMLPH